MAASDLLSSEPATEKAADGSRVALEDGARVAVIGGGPAGSFFSYYLLDMAQRVGLDLSVDVYEPRDFEIAGPAGCNMCGGIVSESLVQMLAAEGINLPTTVVRRGIESYVLHTDEGRVRIGTPLEEKRIAAVHRGAGPKGSRRMEWESFDGYLLGLAADKGAKVVRGRVEGATWDQGRPRIKVRAGAEHTYDLIAVAVGVNSNALKLFESMGIGYQPPRTTKTYVCEFLLGREIVNADLGSSMHVFLLNIPRLEFGAVIPKGDYATVCLLGREIDRELVRAFLSSPEVRSCFPPDWNPEAPACHCSPKMSVAGAMQPYGDRIVFLGDCGVTRLYKDGIGAAYRAAKAAASSVVFGGIGALDFEERYSPACRKMTRDNALGRVVFAVSGVIQRFALFRRAMLRMVIREQCGTSVARRMSTVLWDMFTGSAPYREILLRTLHPVFLVRLFFSTLASLLAIVRGAPAIPGLPAAAGAGAREAPSAEANEKPVSTKGRT